MVLIRGCCPGFPRNDRHLFPFIWAGQSGGNEGYIGKTQLHHPGPDDHFGLLFLLSYVWFYVLINTDSLQIEYPAGVFKGLYLFSYDD